MVKAPASRRRGAMHCSTRCVATKRRWAARTSVANPWRPKALGKSGKFPAMFDYRVSTGYLVKNCLVKPRPKNIGFWEYTWHVTIQKHRILRIHMTCYYGHLWAIVFTLVVMCVCISICTHTHEINAYTEQSSCQKDIRIYSGDFGPRHSLLLSL